MKATVQFDIDCTATADEIAQWYQTRMGGWPMVGPVRVSIDAETAPMDQAGPEVAATQPVASEGNVAQSSGGSGWTHLDPPRWWDGITPRDPGGQVR